MMGWGNLLDRVTGWLPIPKRVEGIKNEIDKLEQEKSEILVHKANEKLANRLDYINKRLVYLRKRLSNISSD